MDTKKFPSWSTLPNGVALSKPTLSFLTDKLGFQGAAPVQYSVVPLMLKGKDVVVEAITGSGKTLAFLIPAMEALLSKRCQQACRESRHNVVVCCLFPTRELANQVHVIAKQMIEHVNKMMVQMNGPKETANLYRLACFVGGHDVAKDIAKFQDNGAHLLLGTPGRLNELLVTCKESVCFELRNFELLVLDEADRLLECGFKPTLTSLLKRLPKQRRTALFSATQSRELADLARAGTRNPLLVTVREHQNFNNSKNSTADKTKEEEEADRRRRLMMLEEEGEGDDAAQQELSAANQNPDKAQVPLRLQNWYHVCRYADKVHALVNYLRPLIRDHKILIYVMTCAGVEWLHAALTVLFNEQENNEDAASSTGAKLSAKDSLFALHGQLGMEQRKKVHKAANAAKNATIVCSDVAARGLDLPNVRYVIQFDAPSDPRTFVHRIGRTARMGQAGDSLLFLSPMETDYIHFLQLQNVFLEKIPKRNIYSDNTSNQQKQQQKYAASSDDDEDDDTGMIMNGDDDDEDEFDDASKIVVNKNRTLASVASDRNRLKAAKGRNAYQKKLELKQKRRSVITTGDLIENDTILTLRRSMAFKGNEALLQKAARAFVSFIRAYKEHECRHIFRLQHIDITDLTNGFALFFVPNCGEIRLMHQLVIPLQEEFDGYTKKLDSSRKEVQAARFAAEKLKKQMKEKEMKKLHTGNIDIVEGGGGVGGSDGDNNTPLVDEDGNPIVTAATQRKKSVHELAKEAKLKIRDGKLSQKAKKKAWAQADMDELRREAFLIKKERAGKLRTDKVNELLGEDKIDHTMMSTRERRQQARRRTRSE